MFFNESPIKVAWAKYAKNEFKRGNYPLAKSLVENGLKYYPNSVEKQDAYDAIDEYISLSDNKLVTINYLLLIYFYKKKLDLLCF